MSGSTANKLMTAEDLWNLPNDHMRHELVKGELTTMAPAGVEHGVIGIKIAILLGNYVYQGKLGYILAADTGFFLSRNPDSVRAPDVAYLASHRVGPSGLPKKFFDGAPDLAVEVLSPSDTIEETEDKVAEYLETGCSIVWLVNPRRKTVTVHQPNKQPLVLQQADTLTGGTLLPSFSCLVSQIFE